MKKNYSKATVEVIEFRAEKGFAASTSATTEQYGTGNDPFSSSSDNNNFGDGGQGVWDF